MAETITQGNRRPAQTETITKAPPRAPGNHPKPRASGDDGLRERVPLVKEENVPSREDLMRMADEARGVRQPPGKGQTKALRQLAEEGLDIEAMLDAEAPPVEEVERPGLREQPKRPDRSKKTEQQPEATEEPAGEEAGEGGAKELLKKDPSTLSQDELVEVAKYLKGVVGSEVNRRAEATKRADGVEGELQALREEIQQLRSGTQQPAQGAAAQPEEDPFDVDRLGKQWYPELWDELKGEDAVRHDLSQKADILRWVAGAMGQHTSALMGKVAELEKTIQMERAGVNPASIQKIVEQQPWLAKLPEEDRYRAIIALAESAGEHGGEAASPASGGRQPVLNPAAYGGGGTISKPRPAQGENTAGGLRDRFQKAIADGDTNMSREILRASMSRGVKL